MSERDWTVFSLKAALAFIVAIWMGLPDAVRLLIVLQCCDILLGFMVAWSNRALRSGMAWRGILKKSATLVVVALTHLIDPILSLNASTVVAVYYCASETLSILENAGRLGVPLPTILVERLEKLRGEKLRGDNDTDHRG